MERSSFGFVFKISCFRILTRGSTNATEVPQTFLHYLKANFGMVHVATVRDNFLLYPFQ